MVSPEYNSLETEKRLLLQELGEDPHRQFNNAFALMALLPFLATFYLIVTKLFTLAILHGEVGFILFVSLAISLCGYWVGFTVIRRVFDQLVVYAAQSRRSSKLKSMLVASVSHEFKNPLSSLKLCLFDIADSMHTQLTSQQQEMLQCCNAIVDRLNILVSQSLDVYKIEAGIVDLNRTKCYIREVISRQVREFESTIRQKNIRIRQDMREAPAWVWADQEKIARVINNILGNAIKFSPASALVAIRVWEFAGFVRISISDCAGGMEAEQLEKIFDKFQRFNAQQEGTGLGLAISKDLVELHGGKILVNTVSGQGSTFTIVLPKDLRQHQVGEFVQEAA